MAGTALMKGVREDAGTSNNGKINQISFLKKTRGLLRGGFKREFTGRGRFASSFIIHGIIVRKN